MLHAHRHLQSCTSADECESCIAQLNQVLLQAQDPFGFGPGGPSISVGQADFSSATPQHVSLPAAPAKKDPFAGLAGF